MMSAAETRKIVKKLVSPLARSVRLMLTRGEITLTDASKETQTVQVKGLDGELLGEAQYPQHWGFTSRPLKGSSGILAALFGARSQTVLLSSFDARWRPKDLAEGEVCLFDDKGQRIYLRRDKIEVISPLAVLVTTPLVTLDAATSIVKGDVQIDGGLHVNGAIASDVQVSVGDIQLTGHRHSNVQPGPGSSGGPTP